MGSGQSNQVLGVQFEGRKLEDLPCNPAVLQYSILWGRVEGLFSQIFSRKLVSAVSVKVLLFGVEEVGIKLFEHITDSCTGSSGEVDVKARQDNGEKDIKVPWGGRYVLICIASTHQLRQACWHTHVQLFGIMFEACLGILWD